MRQVLYGFTLSCVFYVMASWVITQGMMAKAEHVPHLAWMIGLQDASGTPCCGRRDCYLSPIRILRFGEDIVEFTAGGDRLTIPRASVHPSHDGNAYVCVKAIGAPIMQETVRCLFYATGS